MKKITVSGIIIVLILISMLTSPLGTSLVKAVGDPIISGIVQDKLQKPIPDVLVVAQDVSTMIEIASATSNASGEYAMSVPQGTYNLIVQPPPDSGFASTTIPDIEVIIDIEINIVLVHADTVDLSGEVVDRDGNPVPNVNVRVESPAIGTRYNTTNDQGLFSMRLPPDSYYLYLQSAWPYPQNAPRDFWLYKDTRLNLTQNTSVTFTLQTRYVSGKVVDPDGNSAANVSIRASGYTNFDDFLGSFTSYTTSDAQGDFNVTVFTCLSVSLSATPPPESQFGPVAITNINATKDTIFIIALTHMPGANRAPDVHFVEIVPKIVEQPTTVTIKANATDLEEGTDIYVKSIVFIPNGTVQSLDMTFDGTFFVLSYQIQSTDPKGDMPY